MGKHKKVNIGDRFGKLVVVKYNGVKKKKSGATVGLYLCKCDCGKHTVVETSHLTSGWTQSCGCLAGRKKLPNNQSEIRKIIVWYKRGAKRRGVEWKISNADAQEIIQKECFYCGTKFSNNCDGFKYNGIDRVDNEKGYEIGNVVPCCKACNIAKHDMKQKDFVLWARSVAEHTKSLY